MAQNIKLYGDTSITPGDIPTGVVPTRASFTHLWQGCLGNCPKPQYNPPRWTPPGTSAWSFGGYGSGDMTNKQSTNEDVRTLIQNEHTNSGWNSFLNNNAGNKRVVAKAGWDIPSGSVIEYVRVWVRCGTGEGKTKYLQPFWQSTLNSNGQADTTGSTGFPAISSGKTWDVTTKFPCKAGLSAFNSIYSSSKWTTSPITGEVWNAALMERLVWGVRHGKKGTEGQPGSFETRGWHGISALMVEVGYDAAVDYEVTTLPAIGVTGTDATLQGNVDPMGDQGGDYFFEYGTTEIMGNATAHQPQVPGGAAYPTEAALTGLVSDTLYFYRAAATDSNGLVHYGATLSFITVTPCSTRASLVGG